MHGELCWGFARACFALGGARGGEAVENGGWVGSGGGRR